MNSDNQETTSELLDRLERDIAMFLVSKLENNEISFERASLIAKFILLHLPENLSDEQLIQSMPTLDDDFIELAEVVHKYLSEYENKYKLERIHEIADLTKHQHFAEAKRLTEEYFGRKSME